MEIVLNIFYEKKENLPVGMNSSSSSTSEDKVTGRDFNSIQDAQFLKALVSFLFEVGVIGEEVHKRMGPEILGIRDAQGSLFMFWGGAGQKKNFGMGRRRAGRNSSGRGGATVKLGHFWVGAGQGSLKKFRAGAPIFLGAGASLLRITSGIPKQGLWMSIEANKEMTNSCLSPTPVFT